MKKLEEIQTNVYEVYKFSKKMSEKEEWLFSQHVSSFSAAGKKYQAIITTTKGNWAVASTVTGIQLICDNVHNSGTVMAGYVYLHSYPEAQKMLLHYLTGNGEEVEVNTTVVFNEDEALKKFVYNSIKAALKNGKTFGVINILQKQYSSEKWKNAFGRINVPWKRIGGKIEITIKDVYDWHPLESRGTQCVHEAMAMASKYGAKAFSYHGTKMIIKTDEIYEKDLVPNQIIVFP